MCSVFRLGDLLEQTIPGNSRELPKISYPIDIIIGLGLPKTLYSSIFILIYVLFRLFYKIT